MAVSEKLARIEKICGHEFHDKLLLRRALTHPSAVEGEPVGSSYERLEFLGDSILGAIVADALYRSYPNWEAVPANLQSQIEREILRSTFAQAWESTKAFFTKRDPRQIERAQRDPKHLMALVFRSYLGQASRWANSGLPERRADYQIWCGPAMGSFNEWTKGTFLEDVKERHADLAALNILVGACVELRAALLNNQGIELPAHWSHYAPLPYSQLATYL